MLQPSFRHLCLFFLASLSHVLGELPANHLNSQFDDDAERTLSAGDLVRAISHKLPESLVSHRRMERLIDQATLVPMYPMAGLILEVRGTGDAVVDFSVASRFEDEYAEPRATLVDALGAVDAQAYEGRDPKADDSFLTAPPADAAEKELRGSLVSVRRLLSSSPRWRRVAAMLRRYREKRDSLSRVWEDTWLEFDIDGGHAGSGVPEPSVFLGPAKMSPDPGEGKAFSVRARQFMLEFVRMYAVLVGSPLPRPAFKSLLHAIESIPPEGELHQVGIWLSRDADGNPPPVRVIAMMPPLPAVKNTGNIEKYITGIGYKHVAEVMPRVRGAAQLVDEIIVSADVWDTAGDRIGFECFVQKRKGKMYIWQRVVALVTWLKKEGLVSEAKAKALREFMGFDRSAGLDRGVATHEFPLRSATGGLDVGSFQAKISRTVNHVKLVYDPAKGWEAKFYLWVTEVPSKKEVKDPEEFLAPGHDAVSEDSSELVI